MRKIIWNLLRRKWSKFFRGILYFFVGLLVVDLNIWENVSECIFKVWVIKFGECC